MKMEITLVGNAHYRDLWKQDFPERMLLFLSLGGMCAIYLATASKAFLFMTISMTTALKTTTTSQLLQDIHFQRLLNLQLSIARAEHILTSYENRASLYFLLFSSFSSLCWWIPVAL